MPETGCGENIRQCFQAPSVSPRILRSGCKINLYLRIRGVLPNGYHSLESFFLPLTEPHDELEIRDRQGDGLSFSSNLPDLDPENNTLIATYSAYARSTGFSPGLSLFLRKGVPHGAGLGGGSADAAALLLELERLRQATGEKPLPKRTLNALAASIGADVPFFLTNVPARVRGIGDIVEPAEPPIQGFFLVLAVPDLHVSTPEAFKAWDKKYILKKQGSFLTISPGNDKESFVHEASLHNDLEQPVFTMFPELASFKKAFLDEGAQIALMSGSGSGIFGLFAEKQKAEKAVERLKQKTTQVFLHTL